MKATDLMIGDWVQNPLGWKAQVQSIRYVNTIKDEWEWLVKIGINNETFQGNLSLNEIQTIPLTPEILEKNGWEHFSGSPYSVYQLKAQGGYYISLYSCIKGHFEIQISGLWFEIHSVHELQHALRLCGIEKEVEL